MDNREWAIVNRKSVSDRMESVKCEGADKLSFLLNQKTLVKQGFLIRVTSSFKKYTGDQVVIASGMEDQGWLQMYFLLKDRIDKPGYCCYRKQL